MKHQSLQMAESICNGRESRDISISSFSILLGYPTGRSRAGDCRSRSENVPKGLGLYKESPSPTNSGDGTLEPMFDIKIITDYQEFRALKDEWNRLLEDNFSRGIWLRHEWYDCWWQAFGEGAELFVVVMYENSRLTAAIPLMIMPMRIKGIRQRVLRFIENAITPRSNFVFPGISVE